MLRRQLDVLKAEYQAGYIGIEAIRRKESGIAGRSKKWELSE